MAATFKIRRSDTGEVSPPLPSKVSPSGFACPNCKREDVSSWADDGEADLADYWQCEDCATEGEVVLPDGRTTQNGLFALSEAIIEACEPEELPASSDSLSWEVIPGSDTDPNRSSGCPLVHIMGSRRTVLAFLEEHWSMNDGEAVEYLLAPRAS
jgi:hypothetical protein